MERRERAPVRLIAHLPQVRDSPHTCCAKCCLCAKAPPQVRDSPREAGLRQPCKTLALSTESARMLRRENTAERDRSRSTTHSRGVARIHHLSTPSCRRAASACMWPPHTTTYSKKARPLQDRKAARAGHGAKPGCLCNHHETAPGRKMEPCRSICIVCPRPPAPPTHIPTTKLDTHFPHSLGKPAHDTCGCAW